MQAILWKKCWILRQGVLKKIAHKKSLAKSLIIYRSCLLKYFNNLKKYSNNLLYEISSKIRIETKTIYRPKTDSPALSS
jgi:hypothetical protein